MNKLEIYEAVNACETLDELADVILEIADSEGLIQGRRKMFNAEFLAAACRKFDKLPSNVLTRTYGIRQQAIYICHHDINNITVGDMIAFMRKIT